MLKAVNKFTKIFEDFSATEGNKVKQEEGIIKLSIVNAPSEDFKNAIIATIKELTTNNSLEL